MDNENDIVDTHFPEYTEEYSRFPETGQDVSFAAHKDEIYRRNELIAAEEMAKQRAAEEKARADKAAEYRDMLRDAEMYSPEVNVPPLAGRVKTYFEEHRGLIGVINFCAVIAIIAVSLLRFSAVRNEPYVSAPEQTESQMKAVNAPEEKGMAAGRLSAEVSAFSVGVHDEPTSTAPASYDIIFFVGLTNTGDESYSFIEEDFRLKCGKYDLIDPSEVNSTEEALMLTPENSLTYSVKYVVSEDKIYDISGFSYTKHTKADYAADEVNAGYVPNFDMDINEHSYEFIIKSVEEYIAERDAAPYDDSDVSADSGEEADETDEQDNTAAAAVIPEPFAQKAGSYVHNTGDMSFRFTAVKEPQYFDGELFNYAVTVSVEVRNLTAEERWVFADNFFFSDGTKKNRINTQSDYNEETTYFSSWQRRDESEEWRRSPIAFGFDGQNYSKFTLTGYISADEADKYTSFGYDSESGWASAKRDYKTTESFDISLDKLIK